jgi:hypothetical protein
MAQTMVMREGVALATNMGCNNIQAESNLLEIMEACNGVEVWCNESAAIFVDCVDMVQLIGKVTFKHCLREANQVAHELARILFSNKTSYNWLNEAPNILLKVFSTM